MSRVLVSELPRSDLSLETAKKFGDVVCVFDGAYRRPGIFEPGLVDGAIGRRLEELHYDPEVDFICVVGSAIMTALLVGAIMSRWDIPCVKALFYHPGISQYVAGYIGEYDGG